MAIGKEKLPMKTHEEWFRFLLEGEILEKALKYTPAGILKLKKLFSNDVLWSSFDFSKTEEGYEFWRDIHDKHFIR